PNPLVEANLEQLREQVRSKKADVGICFDGDADRCMVVDEKAQIIGCDLLTAWLARGFLEREPGGSIVYDLRSSRSLSEMVREQGGTPVKSRVGHVFMKQVMADRSAVFGGELSGHFYFRDNFNADSGAIAFACVVSELARSGKAMSTLIKPARRYVQSGEINFENEHKEEAIEELKEAFAKAKIEELDGLTLELPDWWCNVRMSNTEPLLRLNLEGATPELVKKYVDEVSMYLGERVAH
ncbi:MAG: phosphomannomutase/phosphoglucomutase, partial [Planctomycetes bacterium]|nr:phosphomannomutase/phosphoglucomutase [Planctomycetota bacterium]